ncbi:hypothetical protein Gorai_013451 [Gossypium raimondii]|uniref:DUF4283 domain-containing protein n=1 Tax=Gossypium raimondii TaxID=29730 RepID=A0A7J8Q5V8_GOSRA|nr:hypothetical protein [Gossypium raimondii]
MSWIRLPGLSGHMYKMKILWEIRGMVMINGVIQKIEYEYLPVVCFSYGYYGHVKELHKSKKPALNVEGDAPPADGGNLTSETLMVEGDSAGEMNLYGPWMLVEHRKRHNFSANRRSEATNQGDMVVKSRFVALDSINGKDEFRKKRWMESLP